MSAKALGIAAMAACLLPAQAAAHGTDSTEVVTDSRMADIVVTGTRSGSDVRHLSQTVTVIGRKAIEESMQPSLLPILTEQVPGLFTTRRGVMGYGVSGGAAGNISLRGLSGSSAQMMVLVDGHPQYAGIFGHPISDASQSMLADRVEVLRGPASVLYGSNAMGGVINIATRKRRTDGTHTDIRAGYGSYNTLETELTNTIRRGRFSSVVSGSYNRSDGHRSDMEFGQYGGYAKVGYDVAKNWNMYADINLTHFDASYPGPVSAPLADGDQSITRGTASLAVGNDYGHTSGAVTLFYNWGNHLINDGYTPGIGEGPRDDRFRSSDNMMGVSLHQSAQLFRGNRTTAGFDWFRYGGEAWTEYVSGERAGTRSGIVDRHEDEWAGYVDMRQEAGRWLTFNAGVRIDSHSRIGTEWIPQAGAALHLPHDMEVKASATKGFRYPTLREMYMFRPKNPDLKPESMWTYEISMRQTLVGGRLSYGVNVFYIDGKDLILTLPNPNGSGMLNQNSGKIGNIGVEAQAAWSIDMAWSVDANYSFLHMENPVIAAPEHKLYAGAGFRKGRWAVFTGLQYVGGLYTSVSPQMKTEDFVLWNLRGQFRATRWLTLWARGENLLAQKYEINAGYPMPGATVTGGINININHIFK